MTTPPPYDAPAIDHYWQAGRDDAARLARAFLAEYLRRPRMLISASIPLVVLVFMALLLLLSGGNGLILVEAFILVAVLVGIGLLTRAKILRLMRVAAYPGARWAIGYGASSVAIYQPESSSVMNYSTFSSVKRGSRDTVVLHLATGPLFIVLPAELCPPAALTFLTDAIARSRPR